mmetsp:Transcript_8244/g.20887  ORF Transcript_8244/g.20887 Transcript_8244/m.20887 type:complete len:214 (-) Transcript_8244:966-1607(-)
MGLSAARGSCKRGGDCREEKSIFCEVSCEVSCEAAPFKAGEENISEDLGGSFDSRPAMLSPTLAVEADEDGGLRMSFFPGPSVRPIAPLNSPEYGRPCAFAAMLLPESALVLAGLVDGTLSANALSGGGRPPCNSAPTTCADGSVAHFAATSMKVACKRSAAVRPSSRATARQAAEASALLPTIIKEALAADVDSSNCAHLLKLSKVALDVTS